MTMGESNGESNETPRPRERRKITPKEHSKARAQVSASQELSPLLPVFASEGLGEVSFARETGSRDLLCSEV